MKKDLAILIALGFLAGSASLLPSGIARADDKTVTTEKTEKTYGDHDLDDADTVTKKKIVRKHHGDEEKKIVKKKTITKGDLDGDTVVEKKTTTTTDED